MEHPEWKDFDALPVISQLNILLSDLVRCMEANTLAAQNVEALAACIRAQRFLKETNQDYPEEKAP